MDRREFMRMAGSGVAVGAFAEAAEAAVTAQQAQSPVPQKSTGQKVLFKVGTGGGGSVESLQFLASYGVNHITGGGGGQDVADVVGRVAEATERPRRGPWCLNRLGVAAPALERHLDSTDGRYLARGSQSRQADRPDLPDDPQLRRSWHSRGEVQHDVHRRGTHQPQRCQTRPARSRHDQGRTGARDVVLQRVHL